MVWLLRLRALRALLNSFQLGWRLLRDPRTPALPKILFGLALLLIVSPINWIPSSIPVLGQLEDLALLAFAVNQFIDAAPASCVACLCSGNHATCRRFGHRFRASSKLCCTLTLRSRISMRPLTGP